MAQAPKEKPAPGANREAGVGNQGRAKHSTGPPNGKAILGAHDSLIDQTERAGAALLASVMEWPDSLPRIPQPDSFPDSQQAVASAILAAVGNGARGWPEVAASLASSKPALVADVSTVAEAGAVGSLALLEPLAETVRTFATTRNRQLALWKLQRALDQGDEAGQAEAVAEIAALEADRPCEGLQDKLAVRAFNFSTEPQRPHPIYKIGNQVLCTEGNLTNIQAPPKAGKSAVLEAMIAAVLNGNRQGPDTLGFSAENPHGHALIHLDTEQSTFDHDQLVRRALRRAQLTEPPAWLMSFSTVDLSVGDRRKAISLLMESATKEFGGVFAVMVDGIGDLCFDPNDSAESFELVDSLHKLAVRYCTTICTVLHENPGSEGGKTRGHLGSQLERKAETNLRLAKDKDGVTTIWAEKARHLYLPREQGPCFQWNDHERMHLSCGIAGEIKQAQGREKATTEAEEAFRGETAMSHTDLVKAVCETFDIKDRAAKDRIKSWYKKSGVIRKDTTGNYRLSHP